MTALAFSSQHRVTQLLAWLVLIQRFPGDTGMLSLFITSWNHHILHVPYIVIYLLSNLSTPIQMWAVSHTTTTYIHAIGLQVFNNKRNPPYKSICTWSLTELYSILWKWFNMVHLLVLNTILLNSQRPRYWIWNTKWAAGWRVHLFTSGRCKAAVRHVRTQTLVISV